MLRHVFLIGTFTLISAQSAVADWSTTLDFGLSDVARVTYNSGYSGYKLDELGWSAGVMITGNERWMVRLGLISLGNSVSAQNSLLLHGTRSLNGRRGIAPYVGVGIGLHSLRHEPDHTASLRTDRYSASVVLGIEPRIHRNLRLAFRSELGYLTPADRDVAGAHSDLRTQYAMSLGLAIDLPPWGKKRAHTTVATTFPAPPLSPPVNADTAVPPFAINYVDTGASSTPTPHDRDADGIADSLDQCPGTPAGQEVDSTGCLVVTQLDRRIVLTVEYAKGAVELDANARAVLNDLAIRLTADPDVTAIVEGFTDDAGDADKNQRLSQRRADAAKSHLVARGIAAKRLTAIGRGESQFLADNASELGRRRNRRLEISFQSE